MMLLEAMKLFMCCLCVVYDGGDVVFVLNFVVMILLLCFCWLL